MTRLTYTVKRRPGGWAVQSDDEQLCCYRTQEQAIAHARQLGHNRWREAGQPCEIQVQGATGLTRTECVYGHEAQLA
ncbi:MAG TPA: DUF2188 domain-containing protein [Caulobacteraceae bacterium]|nr:DUF2188 domain-containing protein [Caulobacteraceae bacterium]